MTEEQHHADYTNFATSDRRETLETVIESYIALTTDQRNWVCNLANAASLLWHAYHSLGVNVNWTGFYVRNKPNELILGPFQGKVACQSITFGAGVCGTVARNQVSITVGDVNSFPGHIACDGETKSEIVVPILDRSTGTTLGVIDLDCLDLNAFSEVDQQLLEQLADEISKTCDF